MADRPGTGASRRGLDLLARALLAWGLLEISSLAALRLVASRNGLEYRRLEDFFGAKDREAIAKFLQVGEGFYYRPDPDLGWVPRPSTHVAASGAYRPTTTNARGLRSLREYDDAPPSGVLRVAAFGDSFVHGDEVDDAAAWTAVLERARADLEVLNFGASGYGPDQAFLRWERDGRPLRPRLVLIGFMTENIGRTVNVFRPFYTPETAMRLAKPRFALEGDRLVLRPTPLRTVADYRPLLDDPAPTLASMGRDDLWYQRSGWHPGTPLDVLPSVRLSRLGLRFARRLLDPPAYETGWIPGGHAYRVTEAVLARFAESVRESGAVPVVVFFPNRNDLQRRREGKPELASPLVAAIRRRGIETVDLLEPIHAATSGLPLEEVFGAVHYSEATNDVVARSLVEVVDRHRADPPAGPSPRPEAKRPGRRPGPGGAAGA